MLDDKRNNPTTPSSHKRVIMSTTQPVITCAKLPIETLEQGVIYVQS